MRRGTMILAAALIVLAGVGIAVGAYNAGEAHGVAQQIQTLETTAPDGSDVVRVVGPGYGFGYGGWGHGGVLPLRVPALPLVRDRGDPARTRPRVAWRRLGARPWLGTPRRPRRLGAGRSA